MARSHSPGNLDDFWQEFQDIESSKEPDGEEEETSKTPDEGEQEAAWLHEAGYGFLVNRYEAGKDVSEDEIHALTSSLPSNHAAVVKRRVDTLNATLKKKQKYTTKIDVRNIFPQQRNAEPVVIHSEAQEEPTTKTSQPPIRPSTLPRGMKFSASSEHENVWIKQMPRSPATSPRNEVVHPEWANNQIRTGKGRVMKNKGGYSMSGVTEEVLGNAVQGVEMLSMEQKGTFLKRNSQLSPISDSDITFDFSIEETGNNGMNHVEKSVLLNSQSSDSLPNFSLVPDKLGITRVQDISNEDLEQVKKRALLEMTAIFDEHHINYSRSRTKKRHKEHGIFGVPLLAIMEHDQKLKPHTKIPLVFHEILSYLVKHCLDTEGILRIPGSSSRVKQLRQEMEEKFYQGTFIWGEDLTPNDVAALMKQFLRELPTPLLTDEYIEAFAQVENLPEKKQQLHALNLLILLLPNVHRDMLHALLDFLEMVIKQSSTNKMSLSNVAMIMAPNIFMAPKVRASHPTKTKGAWEIEIKMAAGTSNMMKMLIKYRNILWTIPSKLLSMVRRQYELEQIRRNKDKTKIKFLAKKDKTEVYKKPALKHETDFQEGVIRIQAPNLTKSSTAIQLDTTTTAGDIVSKFKVDQGSQTWDPRKNAQHQKSLIGNVSADPRNFTFAGDDTFLFEVGGNICERCLPNETNMMALYNVNPNAEWIIKRRER